MNPQPIVLMRKTANGVSRNNPRNTSAKPQPIDPNGPDARYNIIGA